MRPTIRRLLTLAVAAAMLGPLVPGSSTAQGPLESATTTSQLARAEHQERLIEHRITRIRRGIAQRDRLLLHRLPDRPSKLPSLITTTITTGPLAKLSRQHLRAIHHWQDRVRTMKARVQGFDRKKNRRALELVRQRSVIRAWIAQWGVFQTCPVRGYHSVTNNFGVTVRIPDVPVHIHQGDDIMSTYGTPIVAPFDGNAVASSNTLGGMAVTVYGDRGFAYNAHLERYGTLGHVSAGTVIGYVGSTGDARGPHDHFEWHPSNGPAVDPYPYLSVVC